MSRKGREYAEQCADWLMVNSPGITKAYGTREALAGRFSAEGEILAGIARVIESNDKMIRKLKAREKRVSAAAAELTEMYSRAREIDDMALAKAEAYSAGSSHLIPFEPSEYEIARKADGMISRQLSKMNSANGHGSNNDS